MTSDARDTIESACSIGGGQRFPVLVWTGKYDSITLCVDGDILIYDGKNPRIRVDRAKMCGLD